LIWNQSLQKNHERIDKTNIFNLNTLITNTDKNETKVKVYNTCTKNFSNRILAFFRNFKLEEEIESDNYIQIKMEHLIANSGFMNMLDEVCVDNNILERERFLRDCFVLLEEQSLGRMDEDFVEVKTDVYKIKKEILSCFRVNQSVNYMTISDHISKQYNGFYCSDYVRFVLNELISENVVFQLGANTYQLSLLNNNYL
jgi:hypothetical protein